jgi:hypothetical protein
MVMAPWSVSVGGQIAAAQPPSELPNVGIQPVTERHAQPIGER